MLLTGSPQTPNSMGPLVIDQCNPWSNDYRDTIVAANDDEQADAGLSASPTLPRAPDCTYTLPRPQSPTDFREGPPPAAAQACAWALVGVRPTGSLAFRKALCR